MIPMQTPCRFQQRLRGDRRQGFTLLEILLTAALILALSGAMVCSFSSIGRKTGLEEGVRRFETLLRLARAEASNSGRSVRLEFSPDDDGAPGTTAPTGSHHVTLSVESDPVTRPGRFTELRGVGWTRAALHDLAGVQSVRPLTTRPLAAGVAPTDLPVEQREPSGGLERPPETDDEATEAQNPPPVTFYPDGSSDSAEILLSAFESDDTRRMAVRVVGVTGSIASHEVEGGRADVAVPPSPDDPGVQFSTPFSAEER